MKAKEQLEEQLFDEEDLEDEEDTLEGKYLTFVLGKEEFGIEIRHVLEINGMLNITEVPDMPSYIKGVINLRGKVIPVMDVRVRFGMEQREYDDKTCIVVINVKEQAMGLIVDRVCEVMNIPSEDIEAPPELRRKGGNRFIQGMGKVGEELKLLLNAEKLLFEDEETGKKKQNSKEQ